jgi:preprotein translocase subunit SecA
MLNKFVQVLGGDPHKREVQKLSETVAKINDLEPSFEALSDEQLLAKTTEFRERLDSGETLDDLLPEAFAAVREAGKRTIGLRHYDVQMVGGMTLHSGKIAEMRTGEGKTLVATLPLYLNSIAGHGVHLVTVNDYLARRDARWMAPIYQALGLTVGVLQMAARTENGAKAFLVDFDKESPHEDQHQMRMVNRAEAYRADITYGTNAEFGFDYLRDNLTMSLEARVQRGHFFAIVDEVDNILIDEARTPLIISGPAQDEAEWYIRMAQVVRQLRPEDYEVNEKDRTVNLTEIGEAHVEEILAMPLRDPERPEDITPEQARTLGYLEQGLRAQFLFRRNKDYLVQAGKVVIVDEFTGRLMPGRRWSEGLHQAVEAKEGVKVEPENITYATITLQNYFRMYEKLAGMTGTALTEAEEFHKIYKLEVLPIPTNLEYTASLTNAELLEIEERDADGYKYKFYTRRTDPNRSPLYWKRKDFPDVVYRTAEAKLRAICLEILRYYTLGRPQLVGTTSVEHSEILSGRLSAEPIRRLCQTVLLREAWLKAHPDHGGERAVTELEFVNKPINELNIGEMRQVGRNLGLIAFNPDDPANIEILLQYLNLDPDLAPRLVSALQGGIPHQVLNARKHDEESLIIARAGTFGAVTIATNMAGRGVDIKLGGDLQDDIYADVVRVLNKAGIDPYDMTLPQMRTALEQIPREDYGIYETAADGFFRFLDDAVRVRQLGGLHVIGSERHEARRIDNQLRGRAARQGDPGSSRFYLSLEDELMRLFGGNQAENLMRVFNLDVSLPIESGMLGRIVEQAQERVEGNNFDIRKHLLEYDDVLNKQRKIIYGERDQVFSKTDLQEDVLEMLHTELERRIPEGLDDEEGPWKLLAYLEEIQPTMVFDPEGVITPSFPMKMVVDDLDAKLEKTPRTRNSVSNLVFDTAHQALEAEKEHILRSAREILDRTGDALDEALRDRLDTLDTWFEGIGMDEESEPQRRPQELLDELSSLVHIPLRLSGDSLRRLAEGSEDIKEDLAAQIQGNLVAVNYNRMLLTFERRLGDTLTLRVNDSQAGSWGAISTDLLSQVEVIFDKRIQRLAGEGGIVSQTISANVDRAEKEGFNKDALLRLLLATTQGSRLEIDPRTKRRLVRRVTLLNYFYMAARLLGGLRQETVADEILEHLEGIQENLRSLWGRMELDRQGQMQSLLANQDPQIQASLASRFTSDLAPYGQMIIFSLPDEIKNELVPIYGAKIQNEIYRQVLLGAISELWIDYLTRVEALRVSIGLEAYAQKDPLVTYKSKATELFQNLLTDIRLAVISRMFLLQPRRASAMPETREKNLPAPPSQTEAQAQITQPTREAQPQREGGEKKRKRHRH